VFEDGPVSGANTYAAFDPPDLPDPQATSVLSPSRCSTSATGYPGRYTTPIPANILALFEGWLKSSQTVPRYHDNCVDPDGDPYVPSPVPWFEGRDGADDTWMYITVDVVETCNLYFPDDSEYWFNGELRYDNILMGDVIYVNQSARLSEAENAVQIEAGASVEFTATPIPGTPYWAKVQQAGFVSGSSTHAERVGTIRHVHERFGVTIDPHTADGVNVSRTRMLEGVPLVCVETALPAKFAATIREALGRDPERPAAFGGLEERPQRFEVMPADAARVKAFIAAHAAPT
jgi:hypothetical protein